MRATPLGRAMAWLRRQRHDSGPLTGQPFAFAAHRESSFCAALLPMHLPAPPQGLDKRVSCLASRRRQQRLRRRKAAWLLLEWLVGAYTYLNLGCPKSPDRLKARLGPWSVTGRQQAAAQLLWLELLPFSRLQAQAALGRGRGVAKLNQLTTLLEDCADRVVEGSEFDVNKLEAVALPVVPSEVATRLPLECGTVDPAGILKGAERDVFTDQARLELHPQPAAEDLPPFCYRVAKQDEAGLRHLLLTRRFTELRPESAIARRSDGRILLGGLFQVMDRPGKFRLIYDARPSNAGEVKLNWLNLPLGFLFAAIRLKAAEEVRGSGADVESYFPQLAQHPSALSRSAVGRAVLPQEAAEYGYDFSEPSRQVVRVLGMGKLNSPAIAQRTHEQILKDGDMSLPLLALGQTFNQEGPWAGVVYDDLAIVDKVPSSRVAQRSGKDVEMMDAAMAAYSAVGLPISFDKCYGAAKGPGHVPSSSFVAWGTEIRSRPGTAAAEAGKRLLLCLTALKAACLTQHTGAFLRRLSGCFVHPLGHRKETNCVFHRFHKYRCSVPEHRLSKTPADIRDEILIAGLQLPIAVAHLRWPINTTISCSDATPLTGAFVEACVSQDLADAFYDGAVIRSKHVPFNQSPLDLDKAEELFKSDPLVESVVECLDWQVSSARTFRESSHVNLRELGEVVHVSEQVTHATLLPLRRANGVDSTVALGAWAKGRSPAYRVNNQLRRTLGTTVLGRKQLVNFKVDTKANPSDDPTRGVELRAAKRKPKWLRDLVEPEPPLAVPAGYRKILGGACKECFSGSASLSKAWAWKGLWVEPPLEAYPSKRCYIRSSDLDQVDVRLRLGAEIRAGLIRFIHFGLPCKGWAQANRLNGGTRRADCPDGGSQPLPRELVANRQGAYVCELCQLIDSVGGGFFIENPGYSDFWRSTPFKKLSSQVNVFLAKAPLCTHGLKLPGATPEQFCKKFAGFASNVPSISQIIKPCPGISPQHRHDTAWGSRLVSGVRYSLAKEAGRYPDSLCDILADIVHGFLSQAGAKKAGVSS